MSSKSGHSLSDRDIEWADLILVMEQKYQQRIRDTFRKHDLPQIESLEIPDEYGYMDPELVTIIHEGTECFLPMYFGIT